VIMDDNDTLWFRLAQKKVEVGFGLAILSDGDLNLQEEVFISVDCMRGCFDKQAALVKGQHSTRQHEWPLSALPQVKIKYAEGA
jgi:hypothetical protein